MLQAECSRLREELLRERVERCALADRVDALSRMWEAAGLSADVKLRHHASEAQQQAEVVGSWTSSGHSFIGARGQATPEPDKSHSTGLHSSARTLMDESSIVPESSAVIGIRGFINAAEASLTPRGCHDAEDVTTSTPALRPPSPQGSTRRRSPRTVSPESLGGGCENNLVFEKEMPFRGDSIVKDARAVLAEMSNSGVFDRDLGARRSFSDECKVLHRLL